MTKSELIDAVARRTQITKSRAELVVNCVFDSMTAALERGEGIEIRGFGSFTVREYKPYSGRNPRTGRAVPVPEKRLPFFKVGKELKELVNAGQGTIEVDEEDHDHDDEEFKITTKQRAAVLDNIHACRGMKDPGFRGAQPNPYMERAVVSLHTNLARFMGTNSSPKPLD